MASLSLSRYNNHPSSPTMQHSDNPHGRLLANVTELALVCCSNCVSVTGFMLAFTFPVLVAL